jgi:hypothetical protein
MATRDKGGRRFSQNEARVRGREKRKPCYVEVVFVVRLFLQTGYSETPNAPNTHIMALLRKRTIPTERPPLVGEVSANFWG